METDDFFVTPREQSAVKTRIVEKYFNAWATIILKYTRDSIGYLDLFCGPGIYEDGTESTPVKILKKATQDDTLSERLKTIFTDKEPAYVESLKKTVESLPGIERLKYQPVIERVEVGEEIARSIESMKMIPCLSFLDPIGYKGLSLQLIAGCTKDWGCDCILFFNTNRIRAAINNPMFEPLINDLFGEEHANYLRQKLFDEDEDKRENMLIESFWKALEEYAGTRFILPFKFSFPESERTSHHLIFITKNKLAYKIMKEIMYGESTEKKGEVSLFAFSPSNEMQQLSIFDSEEDLLKVLAEELLEKFRGKRMKVIEIFYKHNVGTPYILKNYKTVLNKLEAEGKVRIDPPAGKRSKRKGELTLKDDALVEFL